MRTKNLIIRSSKREDLDYFYEWERIPEVTDYFSIPDNQTRQELEKNYDEIEEDFKWEQFTITLADETPIGRIILSDIEEGWKGEIYRIYIGDLSYRKKGYGREAMQAIMDYCFEELFFERLYLDHYTGNPAAELYKSLGFQYEGILRKNCRKNGKLYDVHLMSLLKDEYEQRRDV